MSRTKDKAISEATRKREIFICCLLAPEPRLPSRRLSTWLEREVWSAGTSPKSTPVSRDTTKENNHARAEADFMQAGKIGGGQLEQPGLEPHDGEKRDGAGDRSQQNAFGQQLSD